MVQCFNDQMMGTFKYTLSCKVLSTDKVELNEFNASRISAPYLLSRALLAPHIKLV